MSINSIFVPALLVLVCCFSSCKPSTSEDSSDTTEVVGEASEAEKLGLTQAEYDAKQIADAELVNNLYGPKASYDFRMSFDNLTNYYENIALGFANEDLNAVKANALPFIEAMGDVKKEEVNSQGQAIIITSRQEIIKKINEIYTASDITAARTSFYALSDAMIALVQTFGTNRDHLYLMHSKEAFNGSGASWLSTKDVVYNPYFGASGINKGEMQEEFSVEK